MTAKHLILTIAVLINATSSARADQDGEQPQQGPPSQTVPVYPAPLSQTTQSTYVPQSVALSGPRQLEGTDGPPPPGYTAVMRTRKGFLIGGGATFGVSYGISAMTAAIGADIASAGGGSNVAAAMWIPVAGPFIQATQVDGASAKLVLAGLGAAQTAGAVLLYYGLTTKKRMFVRNDLVSNMTVTPMAGGGNAGLVLSGQF